MPFVLYFLALGAIGTLAYKAGRQKTRSAQGHDPIDDLVNGVPRLAGPAPPHGGGHHIGCYQVYQHGRFVGLASENQASVIVGCQPGISLRRVG